MEIKWDKPRSIDREPIPAFTFPRSGIWMRVLVRTSFGAVDVMATRALVALMMAAIGSVLAHPYLSELG